MSQDGLFDAPTADVVVGGEDSLVVDLDVYSGPLGLLVELVRAKKLDVATVSVLDVADQFLDWMRRAKELRLELAADWLFMAATLAYLKSRLLLPLAKEERASDQALVEDFTAALRRLNAVKAVVDELQGRPRVGLHWFAPSPYDGPAKGPGKRLDATLHALLSAYAHDARKALRPPPPPVRKPFLVYTVEDAIRFLDRIGIPPERWTPLLALMPSEPPSDPIFAKSRVAATYVAALELAKRGLAEVAQSEDGSSVVVRGTGKAA